MSDKNVRLRITGDPSGAVDANKKVTESLKGLSQAEQNHNRRSEQLAKQQVKILKGIASISQTTSNAQQKDLTAIAAEFSAVTKAIQSQSKLQEKQLKALEKGFNDLGRSAKNAGDDAEKGTKRMSTSLDSLRNKSAVAFAGISAAIGMVTKTFGDFEAQLNTFEGISGATQQQMQGISDLALRIGSTTKFSASQVAEASTEVARMGFTYDQISEAMDGFVTTAIASNVTIGESAELVGKTIRGFKMQANEAGEVGDVLTAAMNRSALSFSDLNLSMKYIGPAAASTNQSLETMTGILGLMADQGIKGEQAGTSMRAMLLRLVNPTKDVTGLLDKLGIQIKDSNGNMRGMDDIMNQVRESSAKYEPTVRAQIAATIFGTEAYSAAAAVLGTTKEKTDDYIKSVTNVNGISKDQAKLMQQGVKNAMIELQSQVEATAIAWGEEFAPAVETGIGLLQDVAKFAADIPEPVKDAGVQVSLFVGGFAGLAGVVTTLTLVKKGIDAVALSAARGAPQVGAFWTAATGPVGWVATGVGLGANLLINQGAESIDQDTQALEQRTAKVADYNTLLSQANSMMSDMSKASINDMKAVRDGLKAQLEKWTTRKDEIDMIIATGGEGLDVSELNKELNDLATNIRRLTGIQNNFDAVIKQRTTANPAATSPTGTQGADGLFGTAGASGPDETLKNKLKTIAKTNEDNITKLNNKVVEQVAESSDFVETLIENIGKGSQQTTNEYNATHSIKKSIDQSKGMCWRAVAIGVVKTTGEAVRASESPTAAASTGYFDRLKQFTKVTGTQDEMFQKFLSTRGAVIVHAASPGHPAGHTEASLGNGMARSDMGQSRAMLPGTRGAISVYLPTDAAKEVKEVSQAQNEIAENNKTIAILKGEMNKLDKTSEKYAANKQLIEEKIAEYTSRNLVLQGKKTEEQHKAQQEQKKQAEQFEKERQKALENFAKDMSKSLEKITDENKKIERSMLEQLMTPFEAEYSRKKNEFDDNMADMTETLAELREQYNQLSATDKEREPLLKQINELEAKITERKQQQNDILEDMQHKHELETIEKKAQRKMDKERTESLQRQDHLTGALAANEADITAEKQRQQLAVQGMLSAFQDTAYAMGLIKDMMAATSVEAANIASNLASFAGGAASAIGQLPQDMPKKPEDMNAEQLAGLFSSGVAGARNWQNMINAMVESIPGFKEADAMAQAYIDSGDFSISFDEFKKRKEGLQELVDSLPAFAKELEGIVAGLEVAKPDSEAYKSYRAGLASNSERADLVSSFTNAYAGGNEAFAEQIRPIIEAASGEWMAIIDEVDKAFADRPVEEKNAEMFRRLAEKRKELDKQVSDARIAYTLAEEEKLKQQREKNLNEVGKVREKIFKEAVAVHEKEIDNFQREIDVLEQRKESLRDDIDALNQEEKAALSKFDVQDKAQFNRMVAGANVSARVQQALDEYINMQQMPMDRTSLRTQREALDQLLALDEQRNETAFLLEDKSAEAYVTTQKDLIAQRAQFLKLQMTDESLSVKERVGLNKEYADLYVQYKEIEQQAIRDKYDVERQKVNDSIDLLDREQESIRDRISGEQQAIQDLTRTYEAEMEIIKNAVNAVRDALSAWSPAIEQVKTDLAGAMADANTAAEQFVNKLNSAELKMMRERANNDYGRASAGNVPVSPVRTDQYRVQGNNGWYISNSDMDTAEGNFFNGGIVPDGHPRDTFRANLRSKEMVLPPNIASHITRSMNASVRKEDNLNLTVYARTKNDADIISQVVESKLKQYDKRNVHLNGNYYGPLY